MIEFIDSLEFVIEKGVPIPQRNRPKKSALSVAMLAMEIGDSFLMKNKNHNALTTMAHHTLGKGNYAIRKDGDGYRVWRTK